MKLIRLENQIVSLENVLEITRVLNEHNHTSMGKKYTLYDTSIFIRYYGTGNNVLNNARINIEDETTPNRPKGNEIFEKIFEIISK